MKKTKTDREPHRERRKPMTEAQRSRNFIAKAKELECDETGQDFEREFSKAVPPKKGNRNPDRNNKND